MKYDLTINGREAELSLTVLDRGARVYVFATVGFVTVHGNGCKSVSHAVYSDFAEYYKVTDRPKRLTQAFKNRTLESVDIEAVKRDIDAHYRRSAW